MKKPLILFVFLLNLSLVAGAIQPFTQVISKDTYCEITYGGFEWKHDEDRDVHFHVINGSGAPISQNNNLTCQVFLYGIAGTQRYSNTSVKSTGIGFELIIPKANIDLYENVFLIQCNSTVYGGGCLSVQELFVTINGRNEESFSASTAVILFMLSLPILLFIVAFFSPQRLSKFAARDTFFRRVLMITSMFLFILVAGVMFSLQEVFGLGLGNEFTTYVVIFETVGTLGLFVFVFVSTKQYIEEMRAYKKNEKERDYDEKE